jgi:hypothetical protein
MRNHLHGKRLQLLKSGIKTEIGQFSVRSATAKPFAHTSRSAANQGTGCLFLRRLRPAYLADRPFFLGLSGISVWK